MSLVDDLRAARAYPINAFAEYLRRIRPGTDEVYLFFEGQHDESFYLHHLTKIQPSRTFVPLRCGNKKGVYDTWRRIQATGAAGPAVVSFFVDKDFSDFLKESWPAAPEICVTDFYSIENYLVTPDAFRAVLREFLRVPEGDRQIDILTARFESALLAFHEFSVALIAAILDLREQGHCLLLDQVSLDSALRVDSELKLVRRRPSASIKSLLAPALQGTSVKLRKERVVEIAQILRGRNPKTYIRGKYEAWFIHRFLQEVSKALANASGGPAREAGIGATNVVLHLGPRVPIPAFLSQHSAAVLLGGVSA